MGGPSPTPRKHLTVSPGCPGLLLPAVFVVSLLYLGPSFHGTVSCLTLASATLGFCMAGIVINPLDIAPR